MTRGLDDGIMLPENPNGKEFINMEVLEIAKLIENRMEVGFI
ncbi:MAG: hypothetical protein V8R26_04955 [Clostridia bacterium]